MSMAMTPSSTILFSLLFSFLLLLSMLVKKVESQNMSFNIDLFTPHSQLLTYERDAFVPPDTPYVRLMAVNGSGFPRFQSVGRVLYNTPLNLWASNRQASFETTITLQMTSANITDGHGITFFIVPVNSTITTGGVADNLGIYDAVVSGSPLFAVEFDIGIAGTLDPNYRHIGININSQRSQNTTRVDGTIMGQRVTARITYDVPTRKINVVATYGSTTATVSFVFNLAALLPQQVQLGLSASTGFAWAAYLDAYTWHFNSTMVSDVYSLGNNDTYVKQYVMSM